MGTNYYKVIPLKSEVKEKLKKKIDLNEFSVDKYGFFRLNGNEDLPQTHIHIGKLSAGWKFLFDYNEWKYFHKSEESLLDWLKDTPGIITDEYGTEFSFENFMEMVNDSYDNPWINGEERYDLKLYYNKYPNHRTAGCEEMYLGKYRVALFTDFT